MEKQKNQAEFSSPLSPQGETDQPGLIKRFFIWLANGIDKALQNKSGCGG